MNDKIKTQKLFNISDINKQILEIKKKIQLSEGQRKALFEVREGEHKVNCHEILKLKKEISQLTLVLYENKSNSTKYRIKSARVQENIGSLKKKPTSEIQDLLDQQIIDKCRKIDLLEFKLQQRQEYLAKLANEYQQLVSKKRKNEVIKKVDTPIKIATFELQNQIHTVKTQWRGTLHVFNRYQDIKKSLQQDAARFEFNMKCVKEQLQIQAVEISRLQKVVEEASEMRGSTRTALVQQEKAALYAAKTRDHQQAEGKRLVLKGKQELEKLEKKIFQSGKTHVRPETEVAEDTFTRQEISFPINQSEDTTPIDLFETLKHATGATSVEEVLENYRSQKDTDDRLNSLRNSSEIEKRQLEKLQESLTTEFERYKYAEAKNSEQNSEEVEKLIKLIEEQKALNACYYENRNKIITIMESVCKSLNALKVGIDPMANTEPNPHIILQSLKKELKQIVEEIGQATEKEVQLEKLNTDEEKWLPPPYNGLIVKSPISQEDNSPMPHPTGPEEEEEEVPTRGYLKKQAQLVVDARSRRKNIRMQRK